MHSDVYLAVYHQMTKKINKIILVNLFVSVVLWFYLLVFRLVFREIKEGEKLSLIEKMKYKLLDIILMLFIFDKEKIDQGMVFYFLLFLSCLIGHYLAIKRSEHLMQQQHPSVVDSLKLWVFYVAIQAIEIGIILQMDPGLDDIVTKLFWYEFCILYMKGILPFLKYQTDLFERGSLTRLDSKFTLFCVVEFLINIARILFFFYYMFYVLNDNKSFRYIHLYQDIIYQVSMLRQTCLNFYASVKLTYQLNSLPDYSPKEGEDNLCVICLTDIQKGKKIHCGHLFHLSCLKRWIQGSVN